MKKVKQVFLNLLVIIFLTTSLTPLSDQNTNVAQAAQITQSTQTSTLTRVTTPLVKKTYRRKKVTKKKDVTVYITNTGKKFHRGNCRYLRKSKISIKKSQAKKRGYTACKICRP